MDHCTTTFPFEDVTEANKQPVIHRMIITHFMSAECYTGPLVFSYAQMLIATKGTDHCCARLRACAANGRRCGDNGMFCFPSCQQ